MITLNAVPCLSGVFLLRDADQYVEHSLLSKFQDTCEPLMMLLLL